MALPTALLIKGLAGIGAIGGVVGGGLLIKKLLQPKDPNEIIEDLGISGCKLEEGKTKKENCSITGEQLKNVKFSDKAGKEVKVTENNKTLTLKIEKLTGENLPSDLLFTFKNADASNDLDIGTDTNKITLKANTNYDFKIKDGTKLEKAWTLKSLGAKVGLDCANDDAAECTLPTTGINVWKAGDDYITGATQTDTTKKMTVTKDTKDHNGGFKFTVTSDISLTPGTQKKTTGGINKLTQSSKSYEIDLKDLGDNKGKKWFLVEKTTSS